MQAWESTGTVGVTPLGDERRGSEIGGRYIVGAQLTRSGPIDTFNATDLWLDRGVALAMAGMEASASLLQTGRLVASINSPYVVHVFACGTEGAGSFVVFERPSFTLAFLAREARLYEWGHVQALHAARTLVVGLNDLHRAGVSTDGLHLGSIGIDGSGGVRVSPWALGYSAPAANSGDGALVASVLESGAPDDSGRMSGAMEIARTLRQVLHQAGELSHGQILDLLREGAGVVELPVGA